MHKNNLFTIGILMLFIGVTIIPIAQCTSNDKFNFDNILLNYNLKFYGLNIESTVEEFEQLLYRLVNNRKNNNPQLSAELRQDIKELSKIFDQINVKEDMTIEQALPLINKNEEEFKDKGINLFCRIHIRGHPAYCYPWVRLFKVYYGTWSIGEVGAWGINFVRIKSLILGGQYCEDKLCENASGKFIGLVTYKPPAMYWTYMIITPYIYVNGLFTLYSKSIVPYS
jgi:hypothetical protein